MGRGSWNQKLARRFAEAGLQTAHLYFRGALSRLTFGGRCLTCWIKCLVFSRPGAHCWPSSGPPQKQSRKKMHSLHMLLAAAKKAITEPPTCGTWQSVVKGTYIAKKKKFYAVTVKCAVHRAVVTLARGDGGEDGARRAWEALMFHQFVHEEAFWSVLGNCRR